LPRPDPARFNLPQNLCYTRPTAHKNLARGLKLSAVTAALSGVEDGVRKVQHIVAQKGVFDNHTGQAKTL
jgi:hypothetical protein